MARKLRLDPVTVLAEKNDLFRAARWAAANIYDEDDERAEAKQRAMLEAAKAKGRG